ncbi:MAG TPA: hypothetical protein VD948_13235 [Rhodothermales bacterium]|nr:hypothetical protein [Rhodothermales bacterium]
MEPPVYTTAPRPVPVTPPVPTYSVPPATRTEAFVDQLRQHQVAAMALAFGLGVGLGVWIRR